jgi:hypothetical protein
VWRVRLPTDAESLAAVYRDAARNLLKRRLFAIRLLFWLIDRRLCRFIRIVMVGRDRSPLNARFDGKPSGKRLMMCDLE